MSEMVTAGETGSIVTVIAGRLPAFSCVKGKLVDCVSEEETLLRELRTLREDYPIELQAPFEGVEAISGGVWIGSRLFEQHDDDAVLKLNFRAGTTSLQIHQHEFSDRVIVVAGGRGEFTVMSSGSLSEPEEKTVNVETGDVLAFPKGVWHTFKTSHDSLLLLSYHSPFIALGDPRQFQLPK